jgi:hypothetical protein
MKIFIQILFFISIAFLSYGQYDKDRYKVDSLQIFLEDKLTYEFNLHGPSQGLFFDRYVYSQLPYIQLKINNNSKDTITKRFREKDAHLMWIRVGGSCGRCDTMAPNDYFILQSGWAGWGYRPVGSFHTSIQIQTQIGDSVANSTIHTWGEVYPEGYSFDKVNAEQKVPEDIDTIRLEEISLYDKSDSIKISGSFEGVYFYNWSEKQIINPDNMGLYTYHVFKRDLEATGLDLDSIMSLLKSKNLYIGFSKPSSSIITWEENYYYTFKCTPNDVLEIKKMLKNINIHLTIMMGSSPTYLDDNYLVFFTENSDLDEHDVIDIIKGKGVSNYEIIPKTKVNFPKEYSYLIKIRLGNEQQSNLKLIEDLIAIPEVSWVTSGRQSYSCYD